MKFKDMSYKELEKDFEEKLDQYTTEELIDLTLEGFKKHYEVETISEAIEKSECIKYKGKKWIREDFVILISVIQNKIDEYREENRKLYNEEGIIVNERMVKNKLRAEVLQELLEERNK